MLEKYKPPIKNIINTKKKKINNQNKKKNINLIQINYI